MGTIVSKTSEYLTPLFTEHRHTSFISQNKYAQKINKHDQMIAAKYVICPTPRQPWSGLIPRRSVDEHRHNRAISLTWLAWPEV